MQISVTKCKQSPVQRKKAMKVDPIKNTESSENQWVGSKPVNMRCDNDGYVFEWSGSK